jgi:hypothetical protein
LGSSRPYDVSVVIARVCGVGDGNDGSADGVVAGGARVMVVVVVALVGVGRQFKSNHVVC